LLIFQKEDKLKYSRTLRRGGSVLKKVQSTVNIFIPAVINSNKRRLSWLARWSLFYCKSWMVCFCSFFHWFILM